MTSSNAQNLIDDLDRLLDRERGALVLGELEHIGELATTKEHLIEKVRSLESVKPENLEALNEKISRNQALLNSALDGIRAVAERVAELRRIRSGLDTYDRLGRKKSIGTNIVSSIEKRA